MDPFPTNIQQAGADVLAITWNDGVESHYRVFDLRAACPCAQCVDELTGKRILDPKNVDPEVKPVDIVSVGNYALQIKWSDGHDTGIYSWVRLRALAAN
ncbi:MAG: DUF971 domain-containing protein [Planctomycetota bacterium]|jgi:ATP-binding protein involved in chromosome partitioning